MKSSSQNMREKANFRKAISLWFLGIVLIASIFYYLHTYVAVFGDTLLNTTLNNNPDLESDLVLHLTFDGEYVDMSSTTAELRDRSGNNHHANWLNHSSTTAQGKIGQGIEFDGVNDYATIVDSDDFDFAGKDVTVAVWFKADTTQDANARFFDHFTGGSPGEGWWLGLDSGGSSISFQHRDDDAGSDIIINSTQAIYNDNQWHHAVVTLTGGTAYMYIDNVFDKSDDFSNLNDRDQELRIGGQDNGTEFTGTLDDMRIYHRALTVSEIERLYHLGATTKINTSLQREGLDANLVAHWTFDGEYMDVSSSTAEVLDRSGNSKTGDMSATLAALPSISYASVFTDTNDSSADTTDVWDDVPNTTLSHSDLVNAGINDGDEMLLIADLLLYASSAADENGFRIADTTGNAIASTTVRRETRQASDRSELQRIMVKTTKPAGEGFVFQKTIHVGTGPSIFNMGHITALGIGGLTEGVHYVYGEDTVIEDLPNESSTSTYATITTPANDALWEGDVLVMGYWLTDNSAAGVQISTFAMQRDSDTEVNYGQFLDGDSDDINGFGGVYVFNNPDEDAHTYNIRLANVGGISEIRHRFSSIIAFPAKLFTDFQYFNNDATIDNPSTTAFTEVASTTAFSTPTQSLPYHIQGFLINDLQTLSNEDARLRIQVDGSTVPSGLDEDNSGTYADNDNDARPLTIHSIEELSGSPDIDLDAAGDQTDQDFEYRTLVAHSLHPDGGKSVAGKVGSGLSFDGTDDYVQVDSPGLPTGDFTYAAWIFLEDASTQQSVLMSPDSGGDNEINIFVNENDVRVYIDTVSTLDIETTGDVIQNNTWNHVVLRRSGSALTMYVNNVEEDTGTDGATLNFSTCPLFIGMDIDNTGGDCTTTKNDYFDGVIDDVRIYDRALSDTELDQLYHLGATTKIGTTITTNPDLENGLVMHHTFDGNDVDLSSTTAEIRGRGPNGFSGDWVNHATNTGPGIIGQGISFTDTSDYVKIDDDPLLQLQTFTVGTWFKASSFDLDSDNDQDVILGKGNGGSALNYRLALLNSASQRIQARSSIGGSVRTRNTSTYAKAGTWYHFVATYDGTDFKGYVNGVEEFSTEYIGTVATSTDDVHIAAGASQTQVAAVTVDDMRIYDRALSVSEILQWYNLGRR